MLAALPLLAVLLASAAFSALAQSRAPVSSAVSPAVSPALAERLDDSRVSMLPASLPHLPGVRPLEQARAQALLDFLQSQRIYGRGGCDATRDLCLPVFVPGQALGALPAQADGLLHPPIDGLLASDDDRELVYIAQAGALLYAPYDGTLLATSTLSGGRMILSFEHAQNDASGQNDQAGQRRLISLLTGQMATDFQAGDQVRRGQPIGRARPIRDASTRIRFQLRAPSGLLAPQDWLQP